MKKEVQSVRDSALYFQEAYNGIKDIIVRQDDLKQVHQAIKKTATKHVRAQKKRLKAAKEVSTKEKKLYETVSSHVFYFSYYSELRLAKSFNN